MIEIKGMSFESKYRNALKGMKFVESYVLPVVKENLGDEQVAELQETWRKQSELIPDDASYEEKYEIAFRNWIRNSESAYNLIGSRLGQTGTDKLIKAAVKANKKKTAGPALSLLKFVKMLSPKTAFRMFAKQMAYQTQAFTPLSVSELTEDKMAIEVPHCKVLDVQSVGPFCTVGCQKVYPLWLESQLKIKMTTDRKGLSCTVALWALK